MTPPVGAADVDSLTSALVDANDQLLALYDLTQVTSNTLDEREAVVEILHRSTRMLSTDAMELAAGEPTPFTVGRAHDLDHLRTDSADSSTAGHVTVVSASHASGLDAELRALRRERPFSTGDRKLLSAVLRTALGAISTARLHRQVLHRALDTRDHQRAAEIAQLALPRWRPELPGTELFAANEPARQTGGDLFCFAVRDEDLLFAVGDVSGKGLTAAVMMTTAISAANAAFRDPSLDDPADHLAMIDRWTHDHLSEAGLFITLFVGRYRTSTGVLRWTNAGHSPCLFRGNDGWSDLAAQTPPIGILTDVAHRSGSVEFGPGDLLVVGSDGMIEQENSDGQRFGDRRLQSYIDRGRTQPLDLVGNGLLEAVERFADRRPAIDDRTLLLLRRRS